MKKLIAMFAVIAFVFTAGFSAMAAPKAKNAKTVAVKMTKKATKKMVAKKAVKKPVARKVGPVAKKATKKPVARKVGPVTKKATKKSMTKKAAKPLGKKKTNKKPY